MGDITRTMRTPTDSWVTIDWSAMSQRWSETMDNINVVITALQTIPKGSVDTTPANRHERRQEASRKHQRAALHGAGDQKRIAVERRGE